MSLFDKLFGGQQRGSKPQRGQQNSLRSVPGAASYATQDGKVIYNLLTPHMQQFMGRCVGAIKKSGVLAKGTGQFSILIGDAQKELKLDRFYRPDDDPKLIQDVVQAAQQLAGRA